MGNLSHSRHLRMSLLSTFRSLIVIPALAMAVGGCDKPASAATPPTLPDANPLVGRWIDTEGTSADCAPSFEFRDDGAMVIGDNHGSKTYNGALSAVDALGYYAWSGHFHAASGEQNCPGAAPANGAPLQFYARLVQGGRQLTICEAESIETCHFALVRSTDKPARATRPGDLGLVEPLGAAIEHAAAAPGAGSALAMADAWMPIFVAAGKPVPLTCEQAGAWSVFKGSLLGTVAGARCANVARATQLAEQSLADPMIAANTAQDAAKSPALVPSRETLEDGSSLFYIPVVVTGHGPVVLWTAIVIDKARSSTVIVQATTSQACPPAPLPDTPRLCRDPKGLVIEVAKALAASPTR